MTDIRIKSTVISVKKVKKVTEVTSIVYRETQRKIFKGTLNQDRFSTYSDRNSKVLYGPVSKIGFHRGLHSCDSRRSNLYLWTLSCHLINRMTSRNRMMSSKKNVFWKFVLTEVLGIGHVGPKGSLSHNSETQTTVGSDQERDIRTSEKKTSPTSVYQWLSNISPLIICFPSCPRRSIDRFQSYTS